MKYTNFWREVYDSEQSEFRNNNKVAILAFTVLGLLFVFVALLEGIN